MANVAAMYVVALVDPPIFTPAHARRLAAVLGCSPFDAADRLRVPGRGPAIVGHFAQERAAEQQLALLEGAGFASVILGPEPPARAPFEVHAVGIDDWVLHLDTANGRRVVVVEDVVAVVWGVRDSGARGTNRDVVWRGDERAQRQGFVWVFTVHGDVAHIEESLMQGLPEGGFAAMAEAIRRACAHAAFDDRLLATRTQRQVLGPHLSPAEHLTLAINLIAYRLLA